VPRIAFIGSESVNDLEVYTIKRTGDGLTRLTNGVPGHIWDVEWSPAGPSRVAFCTGHHIYVMASDGSGLQDLTPGWTTEPWDVVWSSDGTKLAVRDYSPGAITLKVRNADGSGVVQLASDPDWISPPAWSPDGQRLMYFALTDHPRTLSNDRGVWTIKPDGTGRTKVLNVTSGGWYANFQYSPDGTKVVICRDVEAILMNPNGVRGAGGGSGDVCVGAGGAPGRRGAGVLDPRAAGCMGGPGDRAVGGVARRTTDVSAPGSRGETHPAPGLQSVRAGAPGRNASKAVAY
jgi:Tol biopolymer transport system component